MLCLNVLHIFLNTMNKACVCQKLFASFRETSHTSVGRHCFSQWTFRIKLFFASVLSKTSVQYPRAIGHVESVSDTGKVVMGKFCLVWCLSVPYVSILLLSHLNIPCTFFLVHDPYLPYFQDELARVLVTLFDSRHLLYQLLWNMFSKEVELADSMQTLFRGNSLASKIMTFCFKVSATQSDFIRRQTLPCFVTIQDIIVSLLSIKLD